MSTRAVVVHCLEEARAAVAAARDCGVPLTLISAEGAAGFVGALWFRELVELAKADHPDIEVKAILDCADKPGDVLAGLRHGFELLRFTGRGSTAATLGAIAREQGARLLTGRIETLDLLDLPEPEAACRAWLSAPRKGRSRPRKRT